MADQQERVSFLPSDAVQGGGLSDVNATIERARFESWDYKGNVNPPVCALLVTYRPEDFDDELPDWMTQAYSCGPLDKYTPSDDGSYVIAAGSAKGFNKSSNVIAFMNSLVNAGFPTDTLAKGNITAALGGAKVHLVQVTQPKREGLKDGGKEPGSLVLIAKILALPGEPSTNGASAKPAAEKPKATRAAKPKDNAGPVAVAGAPKATDPEIVAEAQSKIMDMLVAAGGKITKAEIAGQLFKALAGETDIARKNAIIQAGYKDETLKNGPWNYDAMTLSLG